MFLIIFSNQYTLITGILLLYPVRLLWRQTPHHHDLYLPVEDWYTYLSPLGLWGRGNHHTSSTDSTSSRQVYFSAMCPKQNFLSLQGQGLLCQHIKFNMTKKIIYETRWYDDLQLILTFICLRLSLWRFWSASLLLARRAFSSFISTFLSFFSCKIARKIYKYLPFCQPTVLV